MKCAACQKPVTTGTLQPGLHVQVPGQLTGFNSGEQLLNEDGTPHRLTCVANNRHRKAIEHADYCGTCGMGVDCIVVYDRQGELHRCKLCGWPTYIAQLTKTRGVRQVSR